MEKRVFCPHCKVSLLLTIRPSHVYFECPSCEQLTELEAYREERAKRLKNVRETKRRRLCKKGIGGTAKKVM